MFISGGVGGGAYIEGAHVGAYNWGVIEGFIYGGLIWESYHD